MECANCLPCAVCQSLNDRLECANSNLLADMERWEKLKVRDVSQLLGAMGDSQINFYEEVGDGSWVRRAAGPADCLSWGWRNAARCGARARWWLCAWWCLTPLRVWNCTSCG